MKRILSVLAAFCCTLCLGLPVRAAGAPAVSAASCVVMDADTGVLLYEKDPDRVCLMASTTKIMTALLVCQQCDLDAILRVPEQAVGIEGSSLYLRPGEELSGHDLLYGLMLQSGNDAAVALALACAGSQEAFVAQMNDTAKHLGLAHTHYANPHGLDSEGNYSTARDLAVLTCEALRNETFLQVVSTKTIAIRGDRSLTNHNKLLWQVEGCIGVKTGYTRQAGRLLVSAVRRGGRTLVCVTVRDPDDWRDHCALYDYFLPLSSDTLHRPGLAIGP